MKTICMTASTFSHFQQFHLPYVNALEQLGYQVILACPNGTSKTSCPNGTSEISCPNGTSEISCPNETSKTSEFSYLNFPLEKKMTSLANFKATKSFRKEVASFDGIICHTALASFFTRLAVLGLRKRPVIICVAHGYLFHENASALKNCVYLLAEKLLAPVTDMLLTMNQWDFEKAKKHHLAKEIYNIAGMGVASHASCPNGTSESEPTPISLPCPENALILMFGGEFSKRKNQIFLIEAMCDLPEEVHLVLAGQGEFYEFCQKKVQEKNLSHRVHFLSQVKHLPLWYEKADIIVSASHSEGLPFHLMEAMLLGKATVVSDIKGHRDLINPNTSESQKSGLLFSLSHKNDYVKAVLKLKEDKNLKQQYEQQAKKQAQQWTLEKVLPQVMARYEQAFKTYEKIH